MIFYRVSRNEYSVGDRIWETGEGGRHENGRQNLELFLLQIKLRNEIGVQSILAKHSDGQVNSAYIEGFLEHIRASEFPSLPVRYKNMMVFRDIEAARYFNTLYRAGGGTSIYEVEVPGDGEYFIGDMHACTYPASLSFNNVREMCQKYWKGEQSSNPLEEVILYPGSEVKIKSVVT
jgi:hypothetical protein